jgi:DNA-directed RNA polymerase specialized sigma subunit
MENRKFSEVLRDAVAGDPDAVETLISRYMPLINSRSIVGGELDEDLRQYILLRVILQIPKFDPDRTG